MTSINLVFRPSVKAGYHPGSLSLRLIHDRRVKCITLPGCRIYPEEWNKCTRGIVKFNHNTDISLDQINNCLMLSFEKQLIENGKMPNTISYYFRNLRAIYTKAVREKYVAKSSGNPFAGIFMGVKVTMKRTLSPKEINRLYQLNLEERLKKEIPGTPSYRTVHHLYSSLRYFGFCFYARGMSFIDMAFLRKDSIRGGFIRYIRKKTGQLIEIKLTFHLKAIIDSFAGEVTASPYLFPLIRINSTKTSVQQYEIALRTQNLRLKKLAELAGISKPLSTHWARHSWATVGKLQNLPVRVISVGLGHTREKTTYIYLNSLDNSIVDEANDRIASAITSLSVNPEFHSWEDL